MRPNQTRSTRVRNERHPMTQVNKNFINDIADELDVSFYTFDNLEEAFIGTAEKNEHTVAVYSQKKIIEQLSKQGIANLEEAWEYYEYNIASLYLGELTPIIVNDTHF